MVIVVSEEGFSIVKIEILDNSRYLEYESFLLSCKHSLFYHSTKYKDFLEDLLNCESKYLLAYENGKIVAALPLMIKDGSLGKVVNSLPYYGSHGGILGVNVTVEAIELIKNELKELNYASMTLISLPTYNNIDKLSAKITNQRISQITKLNSHLSNAEDYILSIIEGSTRRNINKAKNFGISSCIKNNQALSFLERIHRENMSVIGGKTKSKNFFDKIPRYFTEEIDYRIYVAQKEHIDVAALLVFYFNKTVEYFTPVIDLNYRDQQPLALIIFEAMKDAINKGYQFWNWGGTWTTQKGVYQFKKKWAALENIYVYSTHLKNKEILMKNHEALLEEYEGFYVYNFSDMSLSQ